MANRWWDPKEIRRNYFKGRLLHLLSHMNTKGNTLDWLEKTELFRSRSDSSAAVSKGDLCARNLLASTLEINTCGEVKETQLGRGRKSAVDAVASEAQPTPHRALEMECPSELDLGDQAGYLGIIHPLDAVWPQQEGANLSKTALLSQGQFPARADSGGLYAGNNLPTT